MRRETKELLKDLGTALAGMVLIFLLTVFAFACGDGSTPVYNDQGECIANCGDDVLVVDGANPTDAIRDCGSGSDAHCSDAVDVVETDVDIDKCQSIPLRNECKPPKAREATCGGGYCNNGYYPTSECEESIDCQDVPLEDYPPCVCRKACIPFSYYSYNYEKEEFEYDSWWCTPTVEDINFFSDFKFESWGRGTDDTNCGITVKTNRGKIVYVFFPNNQEKIKTLSLGKTSVPDHYLVMEGAMEITAHLTDGQEIARCCATKSCDE